MPNHKYMKQEITMARDYIITRNGETVTLTDTEEAGFVLLLRNNAGDTELDQYIINSRFTTYGHLVGEDGMPVEEAFVGETRQETSARLQQQAIDRDKAENDAITAQVPARTAEQDRAKDWRVRLHLAPQADYLYKAVKPGILKPLLDTDGIIFPYTPEIAVQYNANYENYDLVHSNYRGYFYKGSLVQNLIITATFTAQDREEANYMLAVMHFLRTATKMFYGNDVKRGTPPPILFLTGLGEFQFHKHPCAITMVNYNLPTDVDYIAAGGLEAELQHKPTKQRKTRIEELRLAPGGYAAIPETAGPEEIHNDVTYVPTKLEINFTMIPIQTREQVSKHFSLEDYASGALLKKGYW